MLLHDLEKDKLIHPPRWMSDNTQYLTAMGSVAYGVSGDMSDVDLYGWAFPPKDMVFPHLAGFIPGFGTKPQNFEVWQEHHVKKGDKEYDFQVFSLVKYFDLLRDNNPNMLDSLFTPDRCVLHATRVAQNVRQNRHLFLHKGAYHRFRGYAYQQLKKVRTKKSENPKRLKSIEAYGYDVKFAYHIVRLALECEELLNTGTMHLDQNAPILGAIRAGEWTLERLEKWFEDKEAHLEDAYANSKLPHSADEEVLKTLLMQCLEEHYGDLSTAVVRQSDAAQLVRELEAVMDRYR